MWTKRDKRLESLFIGPSSSQMELSSYFHFHQPQNGQMLLSSTAASSPAPAPTILWKANSARRKRFEPFCSPATPHVPIRQRLSTAGQRGSSSADVCCDPLISGSNPYLYPRRRMSLLQTLRYQNRHLADSGVECHGEQSDRDSEIAVSHRLFTNGPSCSPPFTPVESKDAKRSSSIFKLKNKTFGLFKKRSFKKFHVGEDRIFENNSAKRNDSKVVEQPIYTSIDLSSKGGHHGKSPSTNDSGRGSQGRIGTDEHQQAPTEDRYNERHRETVAVIEQPFYYFTGSKAVGKSDEQNLTRSISCPQLGLNLRIYHEICQNKMSIKHDHLSKDEADSEDNSETDEIFMPINEESFVAEKDAEIGSMDEESTTKSLQSSSCEVECIIEKDEIKFAEKMHRNGGNFSEGQEDNHIMKVPARAISEQQGQENQMHHTHRMELSNGYLTRQVDSQQARSSVQKEKKDDEMEQNEEDIVKDIITEAAMLQSGLEKFALGSNPDLDSFNSVYSDADYADDDDSLSLLMLDHYLPLTNFPRDKKNGSQRSSSLSSLITQSNTEDASSIQQHRNGKVGIVTQTDLSLVHISDQLSAYLNGLSLANSSQDKSSIAPQGMNFLAKHFFEYQSFNNLPHVALQLHKLPPSEAGADQSACWVPKSMLKAGKNQAAPGARANRNNTDTKSGTHKYGRAGKHEFREWGEKHGELKNEKKAPHKDALTKFLSNEGNTGRNLFECEFEERLLQTEPETLTERLLQNDKTNNSIVKRSRTNANLSASWKCETEVLTILTYAPQVQFVTATVKKAKSLPYNNKPFARVMLFEKRRLLEQKQTTVTPTTVYNGCFTNYCSQQQSSTVNSASSSSTRSSAIMPTRQSTDVIFSESFLFRITPKMLDKCHIVIEMFDTDPANYNHIPIPVGHCVIGPMCPGTGCEHWLQMIRKTGLPVCMWHRLLRT